MKKRVYLDTTVPSYLFDERDSIKSFCEVTQRWWENERNKYDIYVSPETLTEAKGGDHPHQSKIVDLVEKMQRLEEREEIPDIVRFYISHKLVPQVESGDAVHLAYASLYKFDFLLTWNCNNLANANKQEHIQIINARLGLPVPKIITPLELFSKEE